MDPWNGSRTKRALLSNAEKLKPGTTCARVSPHYDPGSLVLGLSWILIMLSIGQVESFWQYIYKSNSFIFQKIQ